MTFRDDRDALFARLEAVLQENAVLQRQNAELQRAARPVEAIPAQPRHDSLGNTLRGHAPAWPAVTRPTTLGPIPQSTHGPHARSAAWTVVTGVLLAVFVLGFFITVKLLLLDGVG